MILMPQIFNVTANENARYKCNELEIAPKVKVFQKKVKGQGHKVKNYRTMWKVLS